MENAESKEITVPEHPESEEDRRFVAKYVLHPIQHAARAVGRMTLGDDRSRLEDLCEELGEQVRAVKSGDLGRGLTMMSAQAHTLDALFYYLLEKASDQICYPSQMLLYLKPALKAQTQCQITIQAVAGLSNPRSVAIVQANTNIQVNNSTTLAGDSQIAPNKLLEQSDGERLDGITTGSAVRSDPAVEAMGALDGSENIEG